MDTMAVSKFKARCLAVLQRVQRTGKPVRITRLGKPLADVVAPRPETRAADWLGSMRERIELTGDVVAPASLERNWDALGR